MSNDYQAECDRLLKNEAVKKAMYENPELDVDFLGFLDDYSDLAGKLPKGMHVIDLGCASAIQAVYFSDRSYVGVDTMPVKGRYKDKNVTHVESEI